MKTCTANPGSPAPRRPGAAGALRLGAALALLALACAACPTAVLCGEHCADRCGGGCSCLDGATPAECGCCVDTGVVGDTQAQITRGGASEPGAPAAAPAAIRMPAADPAATAPAPASCPPWSARPAVPVLLA